MGDENVPPGRLPVIGNLRKVNKPLMERRRRQRINDCLNQLKSMLETFTHKQDSYLSKLEKADILEMTVHCVKNLRQRQSSEELRKNFNATKYVEGFDACTREVTDCLQSRTVSISPDLYASLLAHLSRCRRRLLLTCTHQRDVSLAPPGECDRLCCKSRICAPTNSLVRESNSAVSRYPLSLIGNGNTVPDSIADRNSKMKSTLDCGHLANTERTNRHGTDHSVSSMSGVGSLNGAKPETDERACTGSTASRDIDDSDVLWDMSEEVTPSMWRPW